MALTILSVVFLALLILGVPVAFSIGLAAVSTILYEGLPVAVVFQRMAAGMNVFSFLAIPFFIFAGELMLYGGIADRIVAFAKNLVGHIRGGLGMANVVSCTLFGGVSGSPVADVSAMGAVMIPMMKREGYAADYAVNVTTHAALVGALMPTSHNMIIYSLAAGGKVSIAALILAGIVPAVIEHVWSTKSVLSDKSTAGLVLKALFGYNDSPSLTHVLSYVGYLLVIGVAVLRRRASPATVQRGRSTSTAPDPSARSSPRRRRGCAACSPTCATWPRASIPRC